MENVEIQSAELWLKEKSALKFYMRNSPNIRAELALTKEKQAEYKILNGMLSFNPLERARKNPSFITTWTEDDPRKDRKKMEEISDKADGSRISHLLESSMHEAFEITLRLEQSPNPLSRVTLDTERDELGVPRAMLHWDLTEFEKRSLRAIY